MQCADAMSRATCYGGRTRGRRPPRTAAAAAVAVLALLGCATARVPEGATRAARSSTLAGLDLYAAGEFVLAGERFARAAEQATRAGDRRLARKAVTGECLAWLHARRLADLASCTQRLERLQRRARRPDPAVNALVAFGAIAGARPLPPLRIPRSVRPLVRAAAEEPR
ncbi:MAG: hypothetical protein ABFS46_14315 [Myxococcota bacterium]